MTDSPTVNDVRTDVCARIDARVADVRKVEDIFAATADLESLLEEFAVTIENLATVRESGGVDAEEVQDLRDWADRVRYAGLPEPGGKVRDWKLELVDAFTVLHQEPVDLDE